MLGPIQQTNMNREFDTLDVTNDGFIEAADFQILAGRMENLRPDIDEKVTAEIDNAFTDWWKTLRVVADIDHDGRIGREEFVAAVEKGMQEDPNWVEKMVKGSKVTFRAADVEGDGFLTPDQVTQIYRAYGVDEQHSAGTVERIDLNRDGRISIDEYVQAAREVYQSNDPTAPGAVMFGRL